MTSSMNPTRSSVASLPRQGDQWLGGDEIELDEEDERILSAVWRELRRAQQARVASTTTVISDGVSEDEREAILAELALS